MRTPIVAAAALTLLAGSARADLDTVLIADGPPISGCVVSRQPGREVVIIEHREAGKRLRRVPPQDVRALRIGTSCVRGAAALAASHPEIAIPAPPTPTTWYGWQIMASDLVAIGIPLAVNSTGAMRDANTAGFVAGMTVFALGGPIVHAANGNRGKAWGSLSLRVGVPLALAAAFSPMGAAADARCQREGGWVCMNTVAAAAAGAFLGTVGAAIADWAFLSWKPVQSRTPAGTVVCADPARRSVALRTAF